MNGNYKTTIKLLNIIQVMGWLGLIGSLYAAWMIYSNAGFINALSVATSPVMMSLGVMAASQLGGVLIDIAHNTRVKS